MEVEIEINGKIVQEEVLVLYRENGWSSAEKPEQLLPALRNSHTLVTARLNGELVGIGRKMMDVMQSIYGQFHQQMLTADGKAIDFYKSVGFERAGKTEPMWVYSGTEH